MESASVPDCKYSSWFWLRRETGETRPFNCGSWICARCAHANALHLARRIALGGPQRLVTLTGVPNDMGEAYLGFKHLVTAIRRQGWRFSYVRVLEAGSLHGALHWHIAQAGSFIPHRWLTSHLPAFGLGAVNDIRACRGKGISWYLAKTGLSRYMAKREVATPEGWRVYTSSRDWPVEERESEGGWELVRV